MQSNNTHTSKGETMQNHEFISDWNDESTCPEHGTKVRKVYTFGRFEDAEVYTFTGCRCAVCINTASLQCGVATGTEFTYHKSYGEASGRATLIKMQESIANQPFA